MAGNQREMRKKELKAKKDRKNKTIIWIIIAIIVAVLIVMKVCEININTVKEHFTDSSGKLSISQNVEKNNFSYNLDSSQNVTVKNINNKLGVLTPSTFTVIDTKKAVAKYTFDHGYSNLLLKLQVFILCLLTKEVQKCALTIPAKMCMKMNSKATFFAAM